MDKFTKLLMVVIFLICAAVPGFGQEQGSKTITGTVKDSSGDPIPGATVVVKGTTMGTVTDIDGNYSLTVSEGAEFLVISFVGMQIQEIPINNQSQIDVVLVEDTADLDEVIVIGYGTQR